VRIEHRIAGRKRSTNPRQQAIDAFQSAACAASGRNAKIVSDTVPFDRVQDALALASTPGAAEKVVVTFPN
jgi:hypothetical protein